MIPIEFIEILGIELPSRAEDEIFCIFQNISVKIPTNPNTLPFIVLGRDSLFKN